MPPAMLQQPPPTSAAVEEVSSACTKLQAKVESLKTLKAALLKQTVAAAKAAAIAAKQQQPATHTAPKARNSRKRTAASLSAEDADASDSDSGVDAPVGDGPYSTEQDVNRALNEICGSSWSLLQALTLHTGPSSPTLTQQQVAGAVAQPLDLPAAADASAVCTGASEQQGTTNAATAAARSTVCLQQLVTNCMQQLSISAGQQHGHSFAAVSSALHSAAAATYEDPHSCAGQQQAPHHQLLCDLDHLALLEQAAGAATDGDRSDCLLHSQAAAPNPAPPRSTFSPAALLQQFEQQHAPQDTQQQQQQQQQDLVGLIAGRFMLLSTATAADALGPSMSQPSTEPMGHTSSVLDSGDAGLPSYMQHMLKQQPQQAVATRPSAADAAGAPAAANIAGAAAAIAAEQLDGPDKRSTSSPAVAASVAAAGAACQPAISSHTRLSEGRVSTRDAVMHRDTAVAAPCMQQQQQPKQRQQQQSESLAQLPAEEHHLGSPGSQLLLLDLMDAAGDADGMPGTRAKVQQQQQQQHGQVQHSPVLVASADVVPAAAATHGAAAPAAAVQQQMLQQLQDLLCDPCDEGRVEGLVGEGADTELQVCGLEMGDCTSPHAYADKELGPGVQHSAASGGQDSRATNQAGSQGVWGCSAAAACTETATTLSLSDEDVFAAAVAGADGQHSQLEDCSPQAAGPADCNEGQQIAGMRQEQQTAAGVAQHRKDTKQQQQQGHHQQQQQQQSAYVPRFTKRRQNYSLLLGSMQQDQDQQQNQDAATATDAATDSGEDEAGLIEDADQEEEGAPGAVAAVPAVKAVPQLTRRRLSTSTVVAASQVTAAAGGGSIGSDDGEAVDAAGIAAGGVSSSSKKPALMRKLALTAAAGGSSAAGARQQQQQQHVGGLSQAASDTEDEGIENCSDSDTGTQPQHTQQQSQQAALGQWGRKGAVPTLGRRKAPLASSSQEAPASSKAPDSPSVSSEACSSGSLSSWSTSSKATAAGSDSDVEDSDFEACQTPKQTRSSSKAAMSQQPPQALQRASRRGATQPGSSKAATAASACAASGRQQVLLLQPAFRPATAWQYSSGNLLRMSQPAGVKRRFKPVMKPEALLKPPAVTLKQLAHSQGGLNGTGQAQVSPAGRSASLLQKLLGEEQYQQQFCPPVQQAPQQQHFHNHQQQQQPSMPWWQQQQQQQRPPKDAVATAPWFGPPASMPASTAAAAQGHAATWQAIGADSAPAGGEEDDLDDLDWAALDALEAEHTAGHSTGAGGGAAAAAALAAIAARQDTLPQQQQQQPQQHLRGAAAAGVHWWEPPMTTHQPQQAMQQQGHTAWPANPSSVPLASKPIHWQQQKQQKQQQQSEDPLTTALVGLLGLSDDEGGDPEEGPAPATEVPTAQQQQQGKGGSGWQQGHQQHKQQQGYPGWPAARASTWPPLHPAGPVLQHNALGGSSHTAAAATYENSRQGRQQGQGLGQQQPQRQHGQHGQQPHWQQGPYQQQPGLAGWRHHEGYGAPADSSSQLLSQMMEGLEEAEGMDVELEIEGLEQQGMHTDQGRHNSWGMGGAHTPAPAVGGWPPGTASHQQMQLAASGTMQQQHGPPGVTPGAPAASTGLFSSSPGTGAEPQTSQGLLGASPGTAAAGPSQLQQLHDELEDLACQLVFLDELEAAEVGVAAEAQQAAAAGAAGVDGGTGAGVMGAPQLLGSAAVDSAGPTAAAAGGAGASLADRKAGAGQMSTGTGALWDEMFGPGDSCVLVEGPDSSMQDMEVPQCDDGGHSSAMQGSQQPEQRPEQPQEGPGGVAGGAAAADASGTQHTSLDTPGSGLNGSSAAGGVGSKLNSRLASRYGAGLVDMGPKERAAWAAAAKQRQQELYGRFIEIALQGQQAAAGAGRLGLQSLMELVRECIKEELQGGSSDAAAAGANEACGVGGEEECHKRPRGSRPAGADGTGRDERTSSSNGSTGGSSSSGQALDVMRLIKKVQHRHQQLLLERQGLRGPATAAAAAGPAAANAQQQKSGAAAGGPATPDAVAQQRLFVAFLNVAHQNNLAAAASRANPTRVAEAAAASADDAAGTGAGLNGTLQSRKRARAEGMSAAAGAAGSLQLAVTQQIFLT